MSFKASQVYVCLNTTAASATSSVIDLSGLNALTPPDVFLYVSNAATVNIQQSLDQTNWVTVATVTSTDSYVLPPQGVYYRVTITGNNGTVMAQVGPGANLRGELCAITAPTVQSAGPS
jgi:hypothetical protein